MPAWAREPEKCSFSTYRAGVGHSGPQQCEGKGGISKMNRAHLLPSTHSLTAAGTVGVSFSSSLMTNVVSPSLCANTAACAVMWLTRQAALLPHIAQTQTIGKRENHNAASFLFFCFARML